MSDQQFPNIELVEIPFVYFAYKDVQANALTAERDALKAENETLRATIEIAWKIIDDLAALHDSYIGYLVAHNNYNEAGAKAINERIETLKANGVVHLENTNEGKDQ